MRITDQIAPAMGERAWVLPFPVFTVTVGKGEGGAFAVADGDPVPPTGLTIACYPPFGADASLVNEDEPGCGPANLCGSLDVPTDTLRWAPATTVGVAVHTVVDDVGPGLTADTGGALIKIEVPDVGKQGPILDGIDSLLIVIGIEVIEDPARLAEQAESGQKCRRGNRADEPVVVIAGVHLPGEDQLL